MLIPVPIPHLFLIALGGGAGAVLRFLTGHWVNRAMPGTGYPWGTFAVKVIGGFVIGIAIMWTIEHGSMSRTRLLTITGFLGGFTTFSAFSLEMSEMLIDRRYVVAAAYSLSSLLICVGAALLGAVVGAAIFRGATR